MTSPIALAVEPSHALTPEGCETVLTPLGSVGHAIHHDYDDSGTSSFSKAITARLQSSGSRYAMQGDFATSLHGEPVHSAGFGYCHAVVIRNLDNGKVMLLHVEPSGPSFSNQRPWVAGVAEDSIFGLGHGSKEAVIITSQDSYAGGVHDSENFLRASGIAVVQSVRVEAGKDHWSMAYEPTPNRLFVTSKSEGIVYEIPGFSTRGAPPLAWSKLVSPAHPLLAGTPFESRIEEALSRIERRLQTYRRDLENAKTVGQRELFEDEITRAENARPPIYKIRDAFGAFKRAVEALQRGDREAAMAALQAPGYLEFYLHMTMMPAPLNDLLTLLEVGEQGFIAQILKLQNAN